MMRMQKLKTIVPKVKAKLAAGLKRDKSIMKTWPITIRSSLGYYTPGTRLILVCLRWTRLGVSYLRPRHLPEAVEARGKLDWKRERERICRLSTHQVSSRYYSLLPFHPRSKVADA
jgi:hypothetical protein